MDAQLVANAILTWTGRRTALSPLRDDALVVAQYGSVVGRQLTEIVHALENDFYRSDAYLTAPDLEAMGRQSVDNFTSRHPELPHEIAEALAWCYTFDYR